MSIRKTIVVGYNAVVLHALQVLLPPRSVILVEEPDIVRNRKLDDEIDAYSVLDQLMLFAYQLDQSADIFYALVKDQDVESVIPVKEYTTPFAARLAERFGVPGASYGASLIMRDKNKIRAVTTAHGVKNPQSQLVSSFRDVQAFAAKNAGSLIIKPANRQGSIGTIIVHDRRKLKQAWNRSRIRDEGVAIPDRGIPEVTLVEQFIRGKEFSVEALVTNGQIIFSNVTKKDLFDGVNPVESAHTVPAPIAPDIHALLVQQTKRVVEASGFATGIVHCEWLHHGDDVYLVECAGRFPGDGIVGLIDRAYEIDTIALYLQLMRGEPPEGLPSRSVKTVHVRFIAGEDGKIDTIDIDEAAMKNAGIVEFYLLANPGEAPTHRPCLAHRLGAVTVEAENADAAEQLANQAIAGVRISYTNSIGTKLRRSLRNALV